MPKTRKSHARRTHDASRTSKKAKPRQRFGQRALSQSETASLIAGAAVLAAGAAAAVMLRSQVGQLATGAAKEAMAAGHVVDSLGTLMRRSLNRHPFARLLSYAGFSRRSSVMSRLAVPMGILGGLLAASGSAVFLLAPRLATATDALTERHAVGERGEVVAHAV
jgi:hypothetical protein